MLLATPYFELGGGERGFVNLLRAFDRDRVEPGLVALRLERSHFTESVPDDVPIWNLRRERRFRVELPRLVREMRGVIDASRPDVVLSLMNEWEGILLLARTLSGRRFPVVAHVQGSAVAAREVMTQRWRRSAVPLAYRLWYSRAVDGWVAISAGLREELAAFGVPERRIAHIPVPVDVADVERQAAAPLEHAWFSAGDPVVVSVGRFVPHKDYPTLVEAFSILQGRVPSRLVLVGDGEERATIEAAVRASGVAERVDLVGYRRNPFPYVAGADLFVLSSVSEGLPLAIAEALLLGTPVVATDCRWGPSELLDGGRDGLLVPPRDPLALADAMARALQAPQEMAIGTRRARARIEEMDTTRVASRITEFLTEVAGG